jgi:DNA-binding IclR family transcriptional regulator
VARAVAILDVLAAANTPLSLAHITRKTGGAKATAYRILKTMDEAGLVLKDGKSGCYQLGSRVLNYSTAYLRGLDIVRLFKEVGQTLAQEINETLQLGVLEPPDLVFVAKIDSKRSVRPNAYIGKRVPAYATAAGKTLLAALPWDEVTAMFPSERLRAVAPNTIASRTELAAELERVRCDGYAHTRQEATQGLCCMAAPLRDAGGRVVAALDICIPADTIDGQRRQELREPLLSSAEKISQLMGWQGEDGMQPHATFNNISETGGEAGEVNYA